MHTQRKTKEKQQNLTHSSSLCQPFLVKKQDKPTSAVLTGHRPKN